MPVVVVVVVIVVVVVAVVVVVVVVVVGVICKNFVSCGIEDLALTPSCLSRTLLCAVVVVKSVVDIFVFIGDVVDNVVCFVCFLRERGQGGRVVLVQPDLPQTLVRRS